MLTTIFRRCLFFCLVAGWEKRGKAVVVMGWAAALLCLGLNSKVWAAPPFHGSLFTPVSGKTAIGPPAADPVAYYPYEPRELAAWADVTSEVREKVAAHLIERLGAAFYGRLKFAAGEAVNLEELHRVLPASRKFRQEVPTYLLWFEFERPEVGIRVYSASIAVRRDGSVIREINLPPFAAEPGKLKFAALAEVSAGLISQGTIDAKVATVNLAYDERQAQIVWHFEQVLPGGGPAVKVRNIDVNANTGVVLRRYTDHGNG